MLGICRPCSPRAVTACWGSPRPSASVWRLVRAASQTKDIPFCRRIRDARGIATVHVCVDVAPSGDEVDWHVDQIKVRIPINYASVPPREIGKAITATWAAALNRVASCGIFNVGRLERPFKLIDRSGGHNAIKNNRGAAWGRAGAAYRCFFCLSALAAASNSVTYNLASALSRSMTGSSPSNRAHAPRRAYPLARAAKQSDLPYKRQRRR